MAHYAPILLLPTLLIGCTSPAFVLTDESAMERLMSTKHVADLRRRNPKPLTCWVESSDPSASLLYLGENHDDHTVRIGAYRVTADGRVWVNADKTLLQERWIAIE